MKLGHFHALVGPNVWSRGAVLSARLELVELREVRSDAPVGFAERLFASLPRLADHPACGGEPGGFARRLGVGLPTAAVVAEVAVELQTRAAGGSIEPACATDFGEPGVYRVVVRCEEEQLTRACLRAACDVVSAALADRPFDAAAAITSLHDLANIVCLGPTTGEIVRAARARGIPTRRLDSGSLVLLGHGAKQHRIRMAVTDRTGAIAADIAQDKNVTKNILREVGVPVPSGRAVESADDAWHAACEIGLPVVVKPRNANHGRGVSLNLSSREQVMRAYDAALPEGDGVLVEEFAVGSEHRLLVVNGRLVAASRGEPEAVISDGVQTVRGLVDELNRDPRRGEDWASPLCTVILDAAAELMLEQQGYTTESIPPAGANVLLHYNGEFLTDVTDDVHPATAAACVLAARVIGLDIAGIDLIAHDITEPPGDRNVKIIEVNSGPGMRMHFDPQYGKPRPVGDAIVGGLFAPGDDGRIPIVVVHGERRATEVARLVQHSLSASGRTVGFVSADGILVGRDELKTRRADDAASQRAVLLHPDVEAAVCQTSPARVRRDGLGFDVCDVVVLLDDGADADVRRVLIEATHPERGVVILQPGDTAGAELVATLGRRAVTVTGNDDASIAAAVADCVN